MADIQKVLKGWERCQECSMSPIDISQAYRDCEYTIGLYCGQHKLIHETIELLNEQMKEIEQMKAATAFWLKNIADNQLANTPHGYEDFSRQRYLTGVFDGLQMAYEIIMGGNGCDE